MKVLLINGSPHQHGCTNTALQEVAATLEKHSVKTEIFWIGVKPIAGCIACGHCRKGDGCVFQDAVNDLSVRLDSFDGIVVGSPVYYGGPSGQLCAFLDRLFYSNGSRKFAGKLGAAVVSCRRGGATAAFQRLNMYFTMNNMSLGASQYWNQVHGFTPEDVRKDEEGLQTMRTLGQNMAWMLHSIAAGRLNGVEAPIYEPWTPTHFIR